VAFVHRSEAQDCSGKLQYAQQLFDSGQIDEIPAILDSCLHHGFLPDEKQKAYRLIIQVYLFNYDHNKADSLMMTFLKEFPSYKLNSGDPAEFSELFNLYKVRKLWGFGFSLGNNFPLIHVIENFSTANLNNLNSKYSPDGLSFTAGFIADRYIRPNFWISGEMKFSALKFQNIEKFKGGKETLTYQEKTNWIDLPLMVNYSYGEKPLVPYVFAGLEFGYLLSASSEIRRVISTDIQYPDIVKPSESISSTRKHFSLSGNAGFGAHYVIPHGYLSFRVGYSYGLLSYVKPEYRYSNISQIEYDHYIDDNFKISKIFFNISYSRLLYQIKKQAVNDSQN
jgi:hypothetical protein